MDGQLGQGVKTFRITRRRQEGFGIALSGGASPMGGHAVDNSIYISDVVAGGPADGKLMIDDKLIMVNGESCMGLSRAAVVQKLKRAERVVEIAIVRQSDVHYNQSRQPTRHSQHQNSTMQNSYPPQQNRHPRAVQRSTSSQEQSNYYSNSDSEDDYRKPPLANSEANRTIPVSLLADNKRNYGTEAPEGIQTFNVNKPEPEKLTMRKQNPQEKFGIKFGTQIVVSDIGKVYFNFTPFFYNRNYAKQGRFKLFAFKARFT